jgi:stage V sporulation protein B
MTTSLADPQENLAEDRARTAGRGGVAVLGAKVFFLVVGFVQQPLLRLAVGLSDFGALAQALVVSNAINNVVVASGTQGVSRIVAGARGREREALRATLAVHIPLALIVAVGVAAAAPVYASFERAPDVIGPILVLAGVACLYGLYAPLIGYLNGTSRFTRQALLDVTFATLRTVGLVGVGYAFARRGWSGVLGTTAGWVCAAALIVPLAAQSTGLGKPLASGEPRPSQVPTAGAYLKLLGPIAGAQLCTNALLQIDFALLGRFLGGSAAAAGFTRKDVTDWLAIYKECQTFAFLPYQLLFSVTLILFPMLARASAEGDHEAMRAYVARGTRLAAIFGGLLVGVIVALPESMLAFAYGPADAARGAEVLRAMALAQGAFTMLGIATTVLTSIGGERTAAAINLVAVIAVGAACAVVVPSGAFGHAQLARSAQATGGALLVMTIVAAALVRARTGAFLPARTGLRVAIALAACFAIGLRAPRFGRMITPLVAAVVAIVYLGLLVAMGEITSADRSLVRALGRKRGA